MTKQSTKQSTKLVFCFSHKINDLQKQSTTSCFVNNSLSPVLARGYDEQSTKARISIGTLLYIRKKHMYTELVLWCFVFTFPSAGAGFLAIEQSTKLVLCRALFS